MGASPSAPTRAPPGERTVGREAMSAARASDAAVASRDGRAVWLDFDVAGVAPSNASADARERASAPRDDAIDDGFLRPTARARGEASSAREREDTSNDEALARALQDEWDARASDERRAADVGASGGDGACAACGEGFGAVDFAGSVRALGASWHARCFRCDDCGGALASAWSPFGSEFIVAGKPGGQRRVFHSKCYRERHRPKCDVCKEFIPARGGSIEFETTPYWGEMSCPEHATDGTPRCDGCRRYEKRGDEYATLPDDRKLCMHCVQTVVVDQADAEPLYRDVLGFFGTFGLSALGASAELPPLYMCTQDVINAVDEEEGWHHGRTAQVRGMCVSHVETVTTVYRQPTWRQTNTGSFFDVFGQLDVVEHRIPRSTTQKVTAILVLSCLPRLLCGSIIAHETMHMFLRLNGFPELEPVVEEGLCQLFALLWIERQASSSSASAEDVAFCAFLADQIRTDSSAVYGVGARRAIAAHERIGLCELLAHIKRARTFPP